MKNFELAEPRTLDQLTAYLAKEKRRVSLMAGGTDLLGEIKEGTVEPDIVVDLRTIPDLVYIKKEKDAVRIGALTIVSDLAENPLIAQDYPVLKQAAGVIGSPQLRNMGTVGGNLCQRPRCWYYRDLDVVCRKKGGSKCFAYKGRNKYHAIIGGGMCYIVYPSDLAPALIALGADVAISSPRGEKTIALADFYALPSVNVHKENVLERDEVLREVRIPLATKDDRSAYTKFIERGSWDFSVVSAAVKVTVSGKTFKDIRIVLGGIAPVPWRLQKAEEALKGRRLSEEAVRVAAREALQDAKPLEENGYKKDLVEVVLARTVMSLV
jgi:xanthine dehydrogenase YagS FAD-binding subunit